MSENKRPISVTILACDGSPYGWSAVVNSVLQPSLGLRWLLCYEESDRDICHLQKAAPKHWFAERQQISVEKCPTRFGTLSWTTKTVNNGEWQITIAPSAGFAADAIIHIHPPDGSALAPATVSRDKLQSGATVSLNIRK